MPGALLTNEGLRVSLEDRLTARLFLRLFRNDREVLPDSFIGDFSPALFPGYSDYELTGHWSPVGLDVFGRAKSSRTVVFLRGAGGVSETIYGWIMYELPAPDSFLVAGRNFSPPQVMALAGQSVTVQVQMYALKG